MIISYKYKYLFVELPHTGSTAISKELLEKYDGERLLRKHSFYHDFLNVASEDEKKYFVFSCIRNPLDEVVSIYFKFKTNHPGTVLIRDFCNKKVNKFNRASLKRYHFVKNKNADFIDYFKKFYKVPYDNWSSLDHKRFDYVIRFENLQSDFQKALELIGIECSRTLPVVNKTNIKKYYLSYYPDTLHERAKFVFGPFLNRWNYKFPSEWGNSKSHFSAEILFVLLRLIRKTYWRHIQNSNSLYTKIVKVVIGR